jgi:hypothetical protein
MEVQFTRSALVGERCYSPGERAEISDEAARRHLAAGSVRLPENESEADVETADAPRAPESADASPGKRRKVS